ncbi:MAG TPA: hypothetical protein VFL55_06865 [Acetobacteraceae bacterium]|jgi:hypothetical protein|nr:hypothetical protein [Acetobacteraceae bacterium]
MQRQTDPDDPDLLSLNPYRYVQKADLALLYGSRDDAVELIAQAYLAFDLVLLNAAAIRERSS